MHPPKAVANNNSKKSLLFRVYQNQKDKSAVSKRGEETWWKFSTLHGTKVMMVNGLSLTLLFK
ncbi:unnamed protein product, partial [Heterosigma akashiwo]